MLQYQNPSPLRSVDNVDNVGKADASSESLEAVLGFISRRYREIAVAAAIAIVLAIIYLLTATPSYTAAASMLIDSNNIQLFQQKSGYSDLPMDEAAVESQVEVLKSENIALAVIKQLHLTEDPEFVGSNAGLIGALFGAIAEPFTSKSTAESEFDLNSPGGQLIRKSIDCPAFGFDLCDSNQLSLVQSRSCRADRQCDC